MKILIMFVFLVMTLPTLAQAANHYESIELVDYIFDRYAFLGLEPSASTHDIAKKIREMKAQNHPDRLLHLSEDLKSMAKRNWERIESCESFLMNEPIRQAFDQRLAYFKDKSPGLVSPQGTPVISLERDFVDISFLTSGQELNLKEMTDRARIMVSYDPKQFERAQRLFEKMPGDSDLRENFRGALEKKLMYLEIVEKYLWAAAGISGKYTEPGGTLLDPRLLQQAVEKQIELVRSEVIPNFVQEREALLAIGQEQRVVLLLSHDSADVSAPLSAEATQTINTAQSRFKLLSAAIEQNAIERGELLEDLLELSSFEVIHSAGREKVRVFLFSDPHESNSFDEATALVEIQYVNNKIEVGQSPPGMTIADVRNLPKDQTIAAIVLNPYTGSPLLSAGHAYRKILKDLGIDVELSVNPVP